MSKAYYWGKNFTFKEIMNLLSYGTKHPETLTNKQKVTRLYRSTLRKIYATQLQGYKSDVTQFHKTLTKTYTDFEKMLELEPDSIELNKMLEKYQKYQEDLYDPAMVVDECRPYSSSSTKYMIWSDDALKFDPFGYYSKRLTAEKYPEEHYPYFEDYPMNDNHWGVGEIFTGIDDTDYDREAARITAKTSNDKQYTSNERMTE